MVVVVRNRNGDHEYDVSAVLRPEIPRPFTWKYDYPVILYLSTSCVPYNSV